MIGQNKTKVIYKYPEVHPLTNKKPWYQEKSLLQYYNPTCLFYPKLLRENICSPGISRRLVRCFSCGRVACSWWKDGIGGFFRGGNLVVYIYCIHILLEIATRICVFCFGKDKHGWWMLHGSLSHAALLRDNDNPQAQIRSYFLWRIWKIPWEHTDSTKHKAWENRKQWKPQSLATFLGD